MSPAINQQGWVQTWVTSRWKNPSIPGQFSAEINSVQFRQVEYIQFDDDVDIPLTTLIANAGQQPGAYWFEPEPIGGLV